MDFVQPCIYLISYIHVKYFYLKNNNPNNNIIAKIDY